MALIKCTECGKEISDRAPTCLHCGFPLQDHLEEIKTYSVVTAKRNRLSLAETAALIEISGMSVAEASHVILKPGSVIFSHLTESAANYYVQELSRKGIEAQSVEELEPLSETETEFHPVVTIKKFSFPRKDLPFIDGKWKKGFPPLADIFPGATESGIYHVWKRESQTKLSIYSTVTLFDERRKKIGTVEAQHIRVNNQGLSIAIYLSDTANKKDHKHACLAVLGDVDSLPLDVFSRTGDASEKIIQSPQAVFCPKCGSTSVQVIKRGFRGGNAVAGALLLGPVGLAAGAIGSGEVQRVCTNCRHRF